MSTKPKSPVVRELVSLINRHRLTYGVFNNACHAARKETDLHPKKRGKSIPKLLTEDDFTRYMAAVCNGENLKHEILIKLLFYTAVRNNELCRIRIDDVDLKASKIYIHSGKGDKDRYVLFADAFRSLLRAYLATVPDNQVYLFESTHKKHYSTRRIHQIVVAYGKGLDPSLHVHPHLMRHQMLTKLTQEGMTDAQIQLISGHSSKKSLEVYQHMALTDVTGDYQEAMRKTVVP